MATPPLDYHTVTDPLGRPRCLACGSTRTIPGTLNDADFKPSRLRKFFHLSGTLRLHATACAACGHVSIGVDPTALLDLAGDPGEERPA